MTAKLWVLASVLAIGSAATAQAQTPQGNVCGNLWHQRNSIFRDAGYCFNTPEGIAAFGSDECRYTDIRDVPLSAVQRETINTIIGLERRYGCRR